MNFRTTNTPMTNSQYQPPTRFTGKPIASSNNHTNLNQTDQKDPSKPKRPTGEMKMNDNIEAEVITYIEERTTELLDHLIDSSNSLPFQHHNFLRKVFSRILFETLLGVNINPKFCGLNSPSAALFAYREFAVDEQIEKFDEIADSLFAWFEEIYLPALATSN